MFGMFKLKMVEIMSKSLQLKNEHIHKAFERNKVFLLFYVHSQSLLDFITLPKLLFE
jgi:hypothetical protein